MKKLTISSILFLISLLLNSQELKKVILRKCGKNVSEVYQVRRDREAIKEGFIKNSIKRQYELKKVYNCTCEEKAIIEKVTFRLE